jgi:hypothetical protein
MKSRGLMGEPWTVPTCREMRASNSFSLLDPVHRGGQEFDKGLVRDPPMWRQVPQ